MKGKLIILFLCLISLSCIGNMSIAPIEEDDYDPMGYTCWKNDASLNKYSSFKTSATFETSYFETEWLSIATITSVDKKTRISSNSLPAINLYIAAFGGITEDMAKGLVVITGAPIFLSNVKVYVPAYKNKFRVGGGFNTDYYIFYRNSVIYSEGLVGVKMNVSKIKIYADYRFPINRSYLENKEPYINVGIGLFPKIIDIE